jgi:hypothetical protein
VRRIIDEWLPVKNCRWRPVNREAVVEATAKADLSGLRTLDLMAFGIEPGPKSDPAKQQSAIQVIPHTTSMRSRNRCRGR